MKNWYLIPFAIGGYLVYQFINKKNAIEALEFRPWYVKIEKRHWTEYLTNIPLEIGFKIVNRTNTTLNFRSFYGGISINNSPQSTLVFRPTNSVGIRANSEEQVKARIDVQSLNLLDILKAIWQGGLSAKANVQGTLSFEGLNLPVNADFPVIG